MSEDTIEYTTPDEFRLVHKRWAKATEQHEEALANHEVATEELQRTTDALVNLNQEMHDASTGLTRYTVDKIESE